MGAKDIIIRPISSKSANVLCKQYHYSGKVVPNSQIHLGVFLNKKCEGVMQFGPSLVKKAMKNTVPGTKMNEFLELNRMAFGENLPKNSESRALGVAHRLIKKAYPHIKWIVSFADACQCGDGAIYRASGYKLIKITKNSTMRINPSTGRPMQQMQAYHKNKIYEFSKWKKLDGYMLKYIYLLDKNISIKCIPFSKIPEDIKMYKGIKRIEHEVNAPDFQSGEGGLIPTGALQNKGE